MLQKYVFITIVLVVSTLVLGACGQALPDPTAATTPPAAQTPTGIPATPTVTPKPELLIYDQALPLFNYDSSRPFDMTVLSEEEKDGVIIQDLTYTAADPEYTPHTAGKVVAYLVKPSKAGSYAGIVYLHGLGSSWGNRKEFLDEAVGLAHQGVVSLLPTGLFPWIVLHAGRGERDQVNVIKQVVELRRSVDFLLAQPGVDPQRIAFVGHDYGAMHGAVLSGVEKRIKAYVLMAGDNNYSDWAIRYFISPPDENIYRRLMSAVDPITYVPHAAPAALFLQFGGQDGFVAKNSADRLFDAASKPKKLGWYDSAGHRLNEQASQDRLTWLELQLGLKAAP